MRFAEQKIDLKPMTLTLTKPIANWQAEYETGNLEIDEQHQDLFELVNSLHDAVITNKDVQTLQDILNSLASHTIEHFQAEESLMLAAHYPDYTRHKATHDHLVVKVINLLQMLRSHKLEATTDITQFLTDWLTHHIKGEDQKMIQFFQNN